jgi:hypothetical protein
MSSQVDIDNFSPPGLVGFEKVKHWTDKTSVVDQDLNLTDGRFDGVEHFADITAI